MQAIKVEGYNKDSKKSLPVSERISMYWKTQKNTILPYLLSMTFIQVINLILTIWLIPYTEGIAINWSILIIFVTTLIFEFTNKKKRKGFVKKFRALVKYMAIGLVPIVLLFSFITILLIGFMPDSSFPTSWTFTDNSAARVATVDKFRVSQIELKYPVTFKLTTNELNNHVLEWMNENGYTSESQNLTYVIPNRRFEIFSQGVSYHFSSFGAYSLFGMMNDVFIRVIECNDVWGGVKLEAHSNIRLGLKDYNSNIKIIESLYKFIEAKTTGYNRSFLLCEHQ